MVFFDKILWYELKLTGRVRKLSEDWKSTFNTSKNYLVVLIQIVQYLEFKF